MENNLEEHDTTILLQTGTTPVEVFMQSALEPISDPFHVTNVTDDDQKNMNGIVINCGTGTGDELSSSLLTNNTDRHKSVETMADYENLNTMMTKPLILDGLNDEGEQMRKSEHTKQSCETSGDFPKFMSFRNSLSKSLENHIRRNIVRPNKSGNNNYAEDLMDSKSACLDKFLRGNDSRNWKRERGANGDFADEDFRLRFPWKRIAYIGVLLVLGITCAILALMKVCGGADWMNTATFSVIVMGTVMLLPPGLYYARILICISCRCKGYTLWDVPAGPFG